MKKNISNLLRFFLILCVILLSGCTIEANPKPQKGTKQDKIIVYASIYPMYEFAHQIGKDKIDLRWIIPPGAEPHDWEPTAKLIGEMKKAHVLIYNGAGMEAWIDRLIHSLNTKDLVVTDASKGISLLTLHKENHEKDVSFREGQEKEQHSFGKYDPHIWLDPIRAMQQAENIKNAFIQADRRNEKFYEENYKKFAQHLMDLDQSYREGLKNIKNREIIVAHAAFGYLADRYGLKQVAIKGISPQEEPSVAKIVEICDFCRKHQSKYIFFETLSSPKLAEVLAREVGAQTSVLNPIGNLTQKEIQQGKNYLTVMQENLETLKKALGDEK